MVGGCTGGVNATTGVYDYQLYGCDGQKSGAYIFRPNSTTLYACSAAKPTLTVRRCLSCVTTRDVCVYGRQTASL